MRSDGNRIWVAYHLRFFLVNIGYQVVNTLDPEHGILAWTLDNPNAFPPRDELVPRLDVGNYAPHQRCRAGDDAAPATPAERRRVV